VWGATIIVCALTTVRAFPVDRETVLRLIGNHRGAGNYVAVQDAREMHVIIAVHAKYALDSVSKLWTRTRALSSRSDDAVDNMKSQTTNPLKALVVPGIQITLWISPLGGRYRYDAV
jgi:hypothetical protein